MVFSTVEASASPGLPGAMCSCCFLSMKVVNWLVPVPAFSLSSWPLCEGMTKRFCAKIFYEISSGGGSKSARTRNDPSPCFLCSIRVTQPLNTHDNILQQPVSHWGYAQPIGQSPLILTPLYQAHLLTSC